MEKNAAKFIVTNILSVNNLIMSGGRDYGVTIGDKFGILDDEPTEIINPDTGEVLDTIVRYKAILKVDEVRNKYSILSTFDDSNKRQSQLSVINNIQFNVFENHDANTLNVRASDISDVLSDVSDNLIAIGDRLVKMA